MAKTGSVFKQENILRYPRLDTVLMVEEAIQNCKEHPTKTRLWKSLPKKMMYQTFSTVIDYLEYSGKIHIDRESKVVWIWDTEGIRKILKNPKLVVK